MKLSAREKMTSYAILTIFAAFAVVPLIGVLLSALTPPSENRGGFAIPSSFDVRNFAAAWTQGNFSSYMLSSIVVTGAVVVLTVILTSLSGFAFARFTFAGSNVLFYVLLAGLMLPTEAFIIPLYFDLRSLHFTNSYGSLILPQTAQSIAFGIFWMRNQIRQFPGEIIEAARLDGARDMRVLWQIVIPPSLPAVVTLCVLVAMWTWNEFLIPLVVISSESKRTAPLGLAFFQGEHLTNFSLLSAAGVIVALPIVVLYFVLQKRFISGMVGGVGTH